MLLGHIAGFVGGSLDLDVWVDPVFFWLTLIGYLMSVSASEADPDGTNNSQTETATVDAPPSGDVIVDNLDPNTSQTGTWKVSTDLNSFAGQSLWSKKANARFEWHFTIPTTGSYRVFAGWVDRAQITTSAPYTIHHAGGPTTLTVDMDGSYMLTTVDGF